MSKVAGIKKMKSKLKSFTLVLILLFGFNYSSMGQYDPAAAAAFSDIYWDYASGTIPGYPIDYGSNDCANFVSQCLIAGGLNLSAGANGSGNGVDACGCIPFCDYLHLILFHILYNK